MIILTEKPSVAVSFANALGCIKKSGYFENDSHCIVNAIGHLLSLFEPEQYDPSFSKWRLYSLPIIPQKMRYIPIEKTKQQLAIIKKCFEAHKNEPLLLATDAEREGELIGAEILEFINFSDYANAKRFWVSEALTKDVILAGIHSAKPLSFYDAYKHQGYARQHADWLIGMNITRFITLNCGTLLTFGRVQTAVLAAIYEREIHIKNFTKEKYIEVVATLKADNLFSVKLINQEKKSTRFTENAPLVKQVLQVCTLPNTGTIRHLKKEKKTILSPQLFNLTALQKEAHKAFSYSPEKTLSIAQVLYEKYKCLSYPRTPSRVMGDENVSLVKSIYDKIKITYPKYAAGTDEALLSANNKRLFNSADLQDHHALIPLAILPDNASKEEYDVYHLVLERFFTTLKPAYIYNSITITVSIASFVFSGNGIEILQLGWMQGRKNAENENQNQNLSDIQLNASYPLQSINCEEKFTEPQKHFTFTTLLSLMENPRGEEGNHLVGLGTPATRGSILQTLFDRQYTILQGKSILITDKGTFLIETLLKNDMLKKFIAIPETTRWEEQLHSETSVFLNGIKNLVNEIIKTAVIDATYQKQGNTLGKCPLCGGEVREGKKNYYCVNYKNACKFVIWKEIAHTTVSAADVTALLSGKKTRLKNCKNKDGKPFSARFSLKDGAITFEFEKR
jgi:DNA topoisomerase-3